MMRYHELLALFRNRADCAGAGMDFGNGLALRNFDFLSRVRFPDPSSETGRNTALPASAFTGLRGHADACSLIDKADAEIEENLRFRYQIMAPSSGEKARGVIIMLHGFNEKHWLKYLPWAAHLVLHTGKAVLMFPIAFHMNRAPAAWSDARSMHRLSRERRRLYPELISSSLSNVAISTRLHNRPPPCPREEVVVEQCDVENVASLYHTANHA
jgi:hypothetical protein